MDIEFEEQLTADQVNNTSESIRTPSCEEHLHVKQSAKKELDAVLQLLPMETISDEYVIFRCVC